MKSTLLVLLLSQSAVAAVPSSQIVPGTWTGTATIAGRDVHAQLEIQATGPSAKATITLLEARLDDFPLPVFTAEGSSIHFEVPPGWGLAMFREIGLDAQQQRIVFDGELDAAGEIAGTLTLATATVPLRLARRAGNTDDAGYVAEDVGFDDGMVHIAATFLRPRLGARPGARPPVVVFVHGSSSRTRIAHRFEAEALARAGIGALIYDKRGAGESSGANFQVATLDELTSDAEAAVAYLQTRLDVDPRRVGIYGLSQGTWIGAKLAARSRHVAFMISVSGSGISLWEQEAYRIRSMMDLYGYSKSDIDAAQAFTRERFDVSRTGLGWDSFAARMKNLETGSAWYKEFGDGPGSLISARFWWLAFFSYDPRADLQKVTIPVLGLFGGRDRLVPPTEAADAMKHNLRQNRATRFFRVENAEHGMMSPVSVDGRQVVQLISPEYLTHLVDWIRDVSNGISKRPSSSHQVP